MISQYRPCVVDHCGALFTDRHHIKQRSEGGSDREANKCPLCRRHHDWVHANIERAHDLGLILFSWEEEYKTPIKSVRIRPTRDKPARTKSTKVTKALNDILN